MEFATIIAVLAFGIAMTALWLVSDVIKKVEGQNEKFVKAHISVLREEMREMDKKALKLARELAAGAKQLDGLDGRLNDHTKLLDGLKGRTAELSKQLQDLDTSIPQRYRARVPGKDEKPKAKPSIQ